MTRNQHAAYAALLVLTALAAEASAAPVVTTLAVQTPGSTAAPNSQEGERLRKAAIASLKSDKDILNGIKLMRQAVVADPFNFTGQFQLGVLLELVELWDDALACYEKVIASPDARLIREAQQRKQAVLTVQKLDTTPEARKKRKYEERLLRARFYALLDWNKQAVGAAAAAIALDAARPEAYVVAALAAAQAEEYEDAIRLIDKAVSLAPADSKDALTKARKNLYSLHTVNDRLRSAAEKVKAGDYPGAIAIVKMVAEEFPEEPKLRLRLAALCLADTRFTDARNALAPLLDAKPTVNSEMVTEARRLEAKIAVTERWASAYQRTDLTHPRIAVLTNRIEGIARELGISVRDAEQLKFPPQKVSAPLQAPPTAASRNAAIAQTMASILGVSDAERRGQRTLQKQAELAAVVEERKNLVEKTSREELVVHHFLKAKDGPVIDFAFDILFKKEPANRGARRYYGYYLMETKRDEEAWQAFKETTLGLVDVPFQIGLAKRLKKYNEGAEIFFVNYQEAFAEPLQDKKAGIAAEYRYTIQRGLADAADCMLRASLATTANIFLKPVCETDFKDDPQLQYQWGLAQLASLDYGNAIDCFKKSQQIGSAYLKEAAERRSQAQTLQGLLSIIDKEIKAGRIDEEERRVLNAGGEKALVVAEAIRKRMQEAEDLAALQMKERGLINELIAIAQAGDKKQFQAGVAQLEALFARDKEMENVLCILKLGMLLKLDEAGAAHYAEQVGTTLLNDSPYALNEMAWMLINPARKPSPVVAPVSVKLAERAASLTRSKDAAVLDTLAVAQAGTGNLEAAVQTLDRAVTLLGQPSKGELKEYKELRERYKKYQEELAKRRK